jgi:ferrous iron transport protein B
VATLGTIYGIDKKEGAGLEAALRQDLTPGGAVALLVFFAFAMQCISTIAVVRRETGGWKWPIFQFSYMSLVAYAGAFVAAHVIR